MRFSSSSWTRDSAGLRSSVTSYSCVDNLGIAVELRSVLEKKIGYEKWTIATWRLKTHDAPVQSNRLLFAENPCCLKSPAQKSVDPIGNNFSGYVASLSCSYQVDISLLHLQPARLMKSFSSNFSTQQSPHCAVQSSVHTRARAKIISGGLNELLPNAAISSCRNRR